MTSETQPVDTPVAQRRTDDDLVVLTLDDPARRNALSRRLRAALLESIREIDRDPGVRGLVITGAGGAFCSGGAVDEMVESREDGPWQVRRRMKSDFQAIMMGIRDLEIPVIAAINGPAVGAGLDLAMACDLRIAGPDAVLGTGFTRVGLIPGDGAAWFLPRLVGHDRALELLLTARTLTPSEALDIGLVSGVVEDGDNLVEESLERLRPMVKPSPEVVSLAKRLLIDGASTSLAESMAHAASAMGVAAVSPQHQRTLKAMAEKKG